jgi:putative ABC transport system substrate-binding protein
MRRWLCALGACVGLLAGCGQTGSGEKTGQKTVGWIQFTTTASMDDLRNGFIDGLKSGGFEDGKNLKLDIKNAEADNATLDLTVKGFIQDGTDLIAVCSSPALQNAARNVKEKPVVFCGVVDPVAAGAAKTLTDKKPNFTGVYNPFPVEKGIQLVHEILPQVKVVGSLADTNEPFTSSLVAKAKAEADRLGLRWESVAVTSSNDISSGVQALKSRGVQAIFQLPSNLMNQGLDGQIRAARNAKMPMFSNQTEQVAKGVVAAIGIDLVDAGRLAGEKAAAILKGENPEGMPIEEARKQPLKINLKAAEAFGVKIPQSVLDRAEKV